MTAIPAKVAGVSEVIVCTPAREGGMPHPVVLVAADIAGVDRVFRIGGAQAIAAMAYGTETVPRVDMICGPGNIFVTLAKKLLFGEVGIDGLYGPTETVVVADESANPTLCAADLLAQAEHDPLARPVLITTSASLAAAVEKEARTRLERLERASIAKAAMEEQGCIAIVSSLEEALELANQFAPEHISLMVKEPWAFVGQVRNAGAVFLGEFSHEVLGDYVAGPSHVMPTGGTARFSSGLGVHSFVKVSPVTALDRATASELSRAAALIARAEGLTAHAEAAEVREELNKE
jgi:histidinol dehydrogenase